MSFTLISPHPPIHCNTLKVSIWMGYGSDSASTHIHIPHQKLFFFCSGCSHGSNKCYNIFTFITILSLTSNKKSHKNQCAIRLQAVPDLLLY